MKKVISKLFGTTKRAVISLLCIVIISAGLGATVYAVISRDTVVEVKNESGVKTVENSEPQPEAETATSLAATEADTNVNSGTISLEDAKSIALADAGVASSEATFTKAKQKTSHGEEIYDLEFYTGTYEYEYEVLVSDGSIVEKDMDARKVTTVETIPETTVITETTTAQETTIAAETTTAQETTTVAETTTAANSYISVDDAKNIAVSAAGLSISDVIFEKAKLDKEDGIRVYEIEFYQGRTEYEYVINATTGEIVEYDIDYD